jgi:hypothetical protein
VSPIYIRPAREQAEHDRLIRFLQTKLAKKFEVVVNVGDEQTAPVKLGANTYFPDLVLLTGTERKIAGLIEIETGESTNNLEALAQWQHFGRAKVPFHLYVPVLMVDAARRYCTANKVSIAEIWTYRPLYDGFDLVREFHDPQAVANAPKGTSVVAKLLPPVVPTKVEKEPERDIKAEVLAAVEMAARALRASSRMSASARASATKAAAARAAAAKVAAAPGAAVAAVKPAAPGVAPNPTAKPATPQKGAKPVAKADVKPVAKADVKPVAKADVKPVAKADVKQAVKPVAKVPVKAPPARTQAAAKAPAKKAAKKAPAAKPKAKPAKPVTAARPAKAAKPGKAAKPAKATKPGATKASAKGKAGKSRKR